MTHRLIIQYLEDTIQCIYLINIARLSGYQRTKIFYETSCILARRGRVKTQEWLSKNVLFLFFFFVLLACFSLQQSIVSMVSVAE